MNGFWPHDAVGWISIVGPSLGVMGYLLNKFVSEPLKQASQDFKQVSQDLKNMQNNFDRRLDDHERRIQHFEDKEEFE